MSGCVLFEVAGKLELNVNTLKEKGRLYTFPSNAFNTVAPSKAFVRKRGATAFAARHT